MSLMTDRNWGKNSGETKGNTGSFPKRADLQMFKEALRRGGYKNPRNRLPNKKIIKKIVD